MTLTQTLAAMPTPTGSATDQCAALMAWCADQGLLALTVAQDHGGAGLTLAHAVQVTFDLARRSGSAGLTYAMHTGQMHTLSAHAKTPYLVDTLRHVVAARGLVASVVSEPETGGNIHRATAVLAPDGSAMTLHKTTSNTSYVPDAAAFLVTAMDTGGPRPVQRLVVVRADATTAVDVRRNHLMGMQGIDNRAWAFDFRFPPEAVMDAPFATIASATMTAATHLTWAALWSGLAARALDTASRFVKTELPADGPEAGLNLRLLSELRNQHYQLNAMIRDNLTPLPQPFAAAAAINRLKIAGSDLACHIVTQCLRITGLRGYAEGGPYALSEPLRDVLSGPIMVANARLQANTMGIDRYSPERP